MRVARRIHAYQVRFGELWEARECPYIRSRHMVMLKLRIRIYRLRTNLKSKTPQRVSNLQRAVPPEALSCPHAALSCLLTTLTISLKTTSPRLVPTVQTPWRKKSKLINKSFITAYQISSPHGRQTNGQTTRCSEVLVLLWFTWERMKTP